MRMIICDRCKQKIERPEAYGIGSISMEVRGEKGTIMKQNPWKDWDLCPKCVADILEYVEAPTREEEEKPKATVRKRTSKADDVRELAMAGLKPKEIAAELGCSEQTVYKYMKDFKEADDAAENDDEAEDQT